MMKPGGAFEVCNVSYFVTCSRSNHIPARCGKKIFTFRDAATSRPPSSNRRSRSYTNIHRLPHTRSHRTRPNRKGCFYHSHTRRLPTGTTPSAIHLTMWRGSSMPHSTTPSDPHLPRLTSHPRLCSFVASRSPLSTLTTTPSSGLFTMKCMRQDSSILNLYLYSLTSFHCTFEVGTSLCVYVRF